MQLLGGTDRAASCQSVLTIHKVAVRCVQELLNNLICKNSICLAPHHLGHCLLQHVEHELIIYQLLCCCVVFLDCLLTTISCNQ